MMDRIGGETAVQSGWAQLRQLQRRFKSTHKGLHGGYREVGHTPNVCRIWIDLCIRCQGAWFSRSRLNAIASLGRTMAMLGIEDAALQISGMRT